MADGLDLGLSGLASGFDWRTLVDQLADVERAPQRRLLSEQQTIQDRKNAYTSIATQFAVLQNRVAALKDPDLFDTRLVQSSAVEVATALSDSGAALDAYAFHIIQLATASARHGAANIAAPLHTSADVSTLTLNNAPVATAVKAGTITVNGHQISVATTDTLQGVFDKISAATTGDVTGSYDPTTDRIRLTSASNAEIVLGSATDTSNFLQVARLSNNGTSTVTSSSGLGSLRLATALSSANFATAVSDGGSGQGKFKVNGVEISFNASTDTLTDVLARINDANTGVTASYDAINDRLQLVNKTTGDLGMALEDVTGNFLAASGLAGGSLQRGHDLLYTVNGGGQLSSHANVITSESSGISGLTVKVLDVGDVDLTVSSDSSTIKKAITSFIEDYNKAQALIDTSTASSTDAKGKVTAGVLAGEGDAYSLGSELRQLVTSSFSFLSGSIQRLDSLGINTNGDNNSLTLTDSAKLDAALTGNLSEIAALFTHADDGLATKLDAFLEKTAGDDGTLVSKQGKLEKQSSDIDDQIVAQEKQVQINRDQLITSFLAMEDAQLRINQQLQFLNQRFGSGSSN